MGQVRKKSKGRPTRRPNINELNFLYKHYRACDIARLYDVSQATVYSWIARSRAQDSGFKKVELKIKRG